MRALQDNELATYYRTYSDLIAPDAVHEILARAPEELATILAGVTPEQETFAYAEGKWTLRELLGHINDTERMFAFRALHFARGETAPLPGMDQDVWCAQSSAGNLPLPDLLAEFRDLRSANARWARSLDEATLDRSGEASGCEFSVRGLVFILAGHELHHRGVIRERYLPALAEQGDA